MEYLNELLLLIQEGGKEAAKGGGGEQGPLSSPWMCLVLAIGFVAIYYFLLIKPKQDERKEKQEMLDSLDKNDEIMTIGGIRGKVTNVRDDLVTLRIDDSNNTKIKLEKGAISRNITKEEQQQDEEQKKEEKSSDSPSDEQDDKGDEKEEGDSS